MFNEKFPNITKVQLPKQLKDIPRVPMSQLINQLDELQNVNVGDEYPNWVYGIIGIILVLLIIGGIWLY